MLQISFGEVAWFLVLSMIQIAMRDAPGFLDRGTFASYEGWYVLRVSQIQAHCLPTQN